MSKGFGLRLWSNGPLSLVACAHIFAAQHDYDTRPGGRVHLLETYVNQQKGFTLIELMIVVAIIGLIASFALPAYNDHTMKVRFAEVNAISNTYKTAVALCYSETNDLTVCNMGTHGIPGAAEPTDNLAAGMKVESGVISMTGTQAAGGWTSVMAPTVSSAGNALIWTQTGTCLASGACK